MEDIAIRGQQINKSWGRYLVLMESLQDTEKANIIDMEMSTNCGNLDLGALVYKEI